jgi:hypothetical protein
MPSVDNKRPLKVFLCHAHADRDTVKALYTRLTNDGVDRFAVAGQGKNFSQDRIGNCKLFAID